MDCNGCGKKLGVAETRYLVTCEHGMMCLEPGCPADFYLCQACNHQGGWDGQAIRAEAAMTAEPSLGPEPAVLVFGTALMVGGKVISFKPEKEVV